MTYSLEIKNIFLYKYLNKQSIRSISIELNISEQTIYKWVNKYKFNINNKIKIENKKQIGIPQRNTNKRFLYKDSIINFVNENNGCSLNDIHKHIDLKISKSTIITLLQENNISHKRFKTHIVCKSIETINKERKIFAKSLTKEHFMNSIHIDESSFDRDELKRYGYSKKSEEIKKILKHKRNKERYTLLSAISQNGIIETEILEGSVNSDIYLNFIKKINSNPLNINKTIFQDNARIHHACIVKDFCKNNNIKMEYNPAYTPEFNPIELIFGQIKTIYRECEYEYIQEGIIESIEALNTNDFLKSYKHTWKIIENFI
jgi:transposase